MSEQEHLSSRLPLREKGGECCTTMGEHDSQVKRRQSRADVGLQSRIPIFYTPRLFRQRRVWYEGEGEKPI